MYTRIIHFISYCYLIVTIFSLPINLSAEVLFSEDFEGAAGLTTTSKWQWDKPYASNYPFGMMYGEGDVYSIQQTPLAHSGNKVLRLSFTGRNNFCNSCGAANHIISEAEVASGCIGITSGPWGGQVFNRDRGWTRMDITESTDSTVCFNATSPSGQSIIGDNRLLAGDLLRVPYQCGVNGVVGGDINRRLDCDLAINYLKNIQPEDFAFGETLSRRIYFYIDNDAVLPNNAIKLGYTDFINGRTWTYIAFHRGGQLEVSVFGDYVFSGVMIEKGRWYYLIESYTRESSAEASDGSYRLYIAEEGSPVSDSPVEMRTGIQYGNIKNVAIMGNWQHHNDISGYIYLDDIMVSKGDLGPKPAQVRPSSPTGLTIIQFAQ